MFSRLQGTRQLLTSKQPALWTRNHLLAQNLIPKRGSGHNTMDITPSNWAWKHHKNMLHFYFIIVSVPVAVITTILNIRANPELTEIPEGYEPRHWEYFRHPLTRWLAKFYSPMELDYEMKLSAFEQESERMLVLKIENRIKKVMTFYNDHRSSYFRPFFGELFRVSRDQSIYGSNFGSTYEGHFYDFAHDPETPVPVEGYHPDKPVY